MDGEAMVNFIVSGEIVRVVLDWIAKGFAATWWFVVPLTLFYIFLEFFILWRRLLFIKNIPWVFLEIKPPRDVLTTPKAMEQVFSGLTAIYSTPDSWKIELSDRKIPFLKGDVNLWMSFEIVGTNKGVSFFVRTPKKFRKLVETQFYSQYPQISINEVDDYTARFPQLPSALEDMWGAEYALITSPIFPVKTYDFFEERVEERRLDSMTALLESLSNLKDKEEIWIQFIIRGFTLPQLLAWQKDSKKELDKLVGVKAEEEVKYGVVDSFLDFSKQVADSTSGAVNDIVSSVTGVGGAAAEKKEEKKNEQKPEMTPGFRKRLEAIEKKLSKPVFETRIRAIYHAPKPMFAKESNSAAVNAFFRSFGIADLNGFFGKLKMYPWWYKWILGPNIGVRDMMFLFRAYADRQPDPVRQFIVPGVVLMSPENMLKRMILSAEELATLFHFPISSVTASGVQRTGVKKQEPPPNLPMV
jgi:hypothetical protein